MYVLEDVARPDLLAEALAEPDLRDPEEAGLRSLEDAVQRRPVSAPGQPDVVRQRSVGHGSSIPGPRRVAPSDGHRREAGAEERLTIPRGRLEASADRTQAESEIESAMAELLKDPGEASSDCPSGRRVGSSALLRIH